MKPFSIASSTQDIPRNHTYQCCPKLVWFKLPSGAWAWMVTLPGRSQESAHLPSPSSRLQPLHTLTLYPPGLTEPELSRTHLGRTHGHLGTSSSLPSRGKFLNTHTLIPSAEPTSSSKAVLFPSQAHTALLSSESCGLQPAPA